MSGPRQVPDPDGGASESDPVIVAAEIGAGHDGSAELVLTLRFGAASSTVVTLYTDAGMRLMRNCRAQDISELPGHSWRKVLEAGPEEA